MIFKQTKLEGVYLIEIQKLEDERGFFARTFCQREFEEHGLNPRLVQCNLSYNRKKGTLRGLHYQVAPYQEAKVVTCIKGAIYDVIIDLRPGSPQFKEYLGMRLTEDEQQMLYVPEGFAHGFLTLTDDTFISYQMSEFYSPEYSTGVRWNDPAFGIEWPGDVSIISARDANYQDYIVNPQV